MGFICWASKTNCLVLVTYVYTNVYVICKTSRNNCDVGLIMVGPSRFSIFMMNLKWRCGPNDNPDVLSITLSLMWLAHICITALGLVFWGSFFSFPADSRITRIAFSGQSRVRSFKVQMESIVRIKFICWDYTTSAVDQAHCGADDIGNHFSAVFSIRNTKLNTIDFAGTAYKGNFPCLPSVGWRERVQLTEPTPPICRMECCLFR